MKFLLLSFFCVFCAMSLNAQEWDTYSDTWVATDDLGRVLPDNSQVGDPRENKTVSMFYYIWHGCHGYDEITNPPRHDRSQHQGTTPLEEGRIYKSPYDNNIITQEPDDAKRNWGPRLACHHWGESIFGYYVSNDEWIMRRHVQMFADAGVDVITLDVTNTFDYRENYMLLLKILDEYKKQNGKTFKLLFCLGNQQGQHFALKAVYDDLYSKELYKDHYLYWKSNKPLILADLTAPHVEEYKDKFEFRLSWYTSREEGSKDRKDWWSWIDTYPQNYGWHEDISIPEFAPVSVAEHPHSSKGKSYNGEIIPKKIDSGKGIFFQRQFDRAIEIDPEFLYITQFNEWVAMRFINDKGDFPFTFGTFAGHKATETDSIFIDAFNPEYNRDIEPMKGGYSDNYYYQTIQNIRKFKGVRKLPPASPKITITSFDDFKDVQPEYRDTIGDVTHRNHYGWGSAGPYVNATGRNDIIISKVARSDSKWYFYVQTKDALTKPEGSNWMELFIADNTKQQVKTWYGYNLRLAFNGKDAYDVLSYGHDGKWRKVDSAKLVISDDKLYLEFPRRHISENFRFKWWDNRQSDNIIDTLIDGDTAPNARFQYVYKTK